MPVPGSVGEWNMKRQSVIAIAVAVVFGLFAVFLANTYLTASRSNAAPEGTTRVVVAAVPLDYGTEITAEKIRFIDYPANALPQGVFRSGAELLQPGKRRLALSPIAANEPILAAKVTGAGEGASIAALLPDGKRAATVRINDVSGVAGFVQPNDAVDVLITRTINAGERSQQVTDVLLQNIRVIAMGQNARNEGEGQPAVANTATLEVFPFEAQKLALGQQVGELNLVLRKQGEQEDAAVVETVSLNDLRYGTRTGYRVQAASFGAQQGGPVPVRRLAPQRRAAPRREAPRQAARAPAPAAPTTRNVDVVRGTTQSSYEVGGFGG
jgi:pilus assembly protein CpaB